MTAKTLPRVFSRLSIRLMLLATAAFVVAGRTGVGPFVQAQGNPIAQENNQAGSPASEWDVNGAGDESIQGFATDISVNTGQTVQFKIKTVSANYRIDIYRLGYYQGAGARLVAANLVPSASLPQTQPPCQVNGPTGLTDCGNWGVSASWSTAGAVSGIYLAKLKRIDTGGASHIVFIVRDDARKADVVMQTSDTTWQAYNRYGTGSLYCGGPQSNLGTAYATSCSSRSTKVSYNRPFDTRNHDATSFLFNAEYPMVRWLEANGYDVKYITGVDTDRRAGDLVAEATKPKAFLSVGHDEYWSAGQRASVEAARGAGVNLAFLSGNEIYWKTRWEPGADGTPYRTLVGYKDTLGGVKLDPMPGVTTATWRDTRFGPPTADGGRPENGLIGQIWTVNSGTSSITVPASMANLRLWRDTSVASLTSGFATLGSETLGYEWGEDLDNGSRPAGVIHLSSTTVTGVEKILDFGETVGMGTATHTLTMYRHDSGALVFGAGTVQWSWGLDGNHDRGSGAPSRTMQQATVNLLADMGAQPASLQVGADPATPLVLATKTSDTFAPTSTITAPVAADTVESGDRVIVTGTASDSGGVVAGVEVSVDGGSTWHPAQGTTTWTYEWAVTTSGPATIRTRAMDDSGNQETPGTGIEVTVSGASCPCTSLWSPATVPSVPATDDGNAYELGLKFRTDVAGQINGVRFYKGAGNSGTHIGNLWTSAGTLLASATFVDESPSGWQEQLFDAPVAVAADTTYVVSYHTNVGHYSFSAAYFNGHGIDRPPLHAPASTPVSGNGVFLSGATGFPNNTFNAANYWVDVVFSSTPDTMAPTITGIGSTPIDGSSAIITWNTDESATSRVDYSTDRTFPVAGTHSVSDGAFVTAHSVRLTGLIPSTAYYFRMRSTDRAGNEASRPTLPPAGAPPTTEGPLPPTFTTPSPTLRDTTTSHFGAGTSSGTYVSETGDGELMLAPEGGAEFSGSALPADWSTNEWSPGGTAVVAGGRLSVDGMRVAQEQANVSAGHSLEFVATFTGDPYQHSGYGQSLTTGGEPLALFSTSWTDSQGVFQSGGSLGVRTYNGTDPAGETRTNLGDGLLGSPHRYRIDWMPSQVVYFVDDVQVAAHAVTISDQMRPVAASDFTAFAGTIVIDWVRTTPYESTGSFLSRVFDAGTSVTWQDINWVATVPPSTTLSISVRTGSTATPDGSWSPFASIAVPGALSLHSRYIQYRAEMATANPDRTPVLEDVIISGAAVPPTPPPVTPVIAWPAPAAITYGTPLEATQLNATTNVPAGAGTLAYTPASGEVLPPGDHTLSVTFTPATPPPPPGTIYTTATASVTITVNKATPAITWGAPAAITYGTTIGATQLNATASVAGTFVYTPAAGAVLSAGAQTLSATFTPTDTTNYAVTTASVAITVNKATPAITWNAPANIIGGTALSATQLNATASVPGSFVYTPGIGTVLSAGPAQPLLTTFTPTDAANYTTATRTVPITVLALVSVVDVSVTEGNVTGATKQAWFTVKLAQKSTAWVTVNYTTTPDTADEHVDYYAVSDIVQFAPGALTASAAIPIVQETVGEASESFFLDFSGVLNGVLIAGRSTITIVNDDSSSHVTSSIADFSAGTLGGGAYLSETTNGELMLAPQGSEFSGTSLPAGWTSTPLAPGASSTVANGGLVMSGAGLVGPTETGSGQTLEFTAAFTPSPDQSIGLGKSTVLGSPMAMFIIRSSDLQLYARTINGTKFVETAMGGIDWIGIPHRFQITWTATAVSYYIDGALMISHTNMGWGAVTMRPVILDPAGGDGALGVDWIRMTPYSGSGTFTSAVFDATGTVLWQKLTTTSTVPSGTTSTITYRKGNTPVPDATWTTFGPLGGGGALTGSTRYVQFAIQITTSSGAKSPVIQDITILFKR